MLVIFEIIELRSGCGCKKNPDNLKFLNAALRRSGVSAERRKSLEVEGFGFLPKAATRCLRNR
jgi:hypothetical protein